MLRNTLIALTAGASLAMGAAALTPAMANYPACTRTPPQPAARATTTSRRSCSTWPQIATRQRRISRAVQRVSDGHHSRPSHSRLAGSLLPAGISQGLNVRKWPRNPTERSVKWLPKQSRSQYRSSL